MDIRTAEQMTDSVIAEVARQITEGYTSGVIDDTNRRIRITWSLNAEIINH